MFFNGHLVELVGDELIYGQSGAWAGGSEWTDGGEAAAGGGSGKGIWGGTYIIFM